MNRVQKFLATPFGLAMLALLVFAGWAAWSAGILDGPLARDVRSSSVYVASGVDVDEAAAEKIIGNRRLVVAFMEPGADLSSGCDDVSSAADGALVVLLSPAEGEFDQYGCALFPGADDDNFGKAYVAESAIGGGADQFVDRPLDALRVIAVNYDGLVKAGIVPDGARTISPSLPRYLIALSAVAAVIGGAIAVWVFGLRAGRLAAAHRAERDAAEDVRGSVAAKAAVLAKHIISLDGRVSGREFRRRYRQLAADYAELAAGLGDGDVEPERVDSLIDRAERLSAQVRRNKK